MTETLTRWAKRGLIYAPSGDASWRQTHAMVPTPWLTPAGSLRLFVGFCSPGPVSRIGYIDVNPDNPSEVLAVSDNPCLDIGEPGCFDDNGVSPVWALPSPEGLYIFYAGFQLQTKIRYTIFAGLALSNDGGETFRRVKRTPLLERSDAEPYFRTAPCILPSEAGWRMWYIGGDGWVSDRGAARPNYTTRYLESYAVTVWEGPSAPCALTLLPNEFGMARPVVSVSGGKYRMSFSSRVFGQGYRVCFATSSDGTNWNRERHEGLDPGPEAWDSEMVCYAMPFTHRGRTWLFYNGNDFGGTGLGYAELVEGTWE